MLFTIQLKIDLKGLHCVGKIENKTVSIVNFKICSSCITNMGLALFCKVGEWGGVFYWVLYTLQCTWHFSMSFNRWPCPWFSCYNCKTITCWYFLWGQWLIGELWLIAFALGLISHKITPMRSMGYCLLGPW